MKSVEITTEYITLGQLLKYVGIIAYGSEAKTFLATTQVHVNNETESRRGRKLYPEDQVVILGQGYRIKSNVSH